MILQSKWMWHYSLYTSTGDLVICNENECEKKKKEIKIFSRPGYPHPVSYELKNSGIRVAVGDCSVTERRRWRPPYQTGKTVHVHAKHCKHNGDVRTAPGVCGNGSVPLSHSGNVVTRIGTHTHIGDELAFHRRGLCVSGSAQVTQRWDDVNCRTGVALPTGFPDQVAGPRSAVGRTHDS